MRKRTCAIALVTMFVLGVAEAPAQAVPMTGPRSSVHSL